MGCTPAVKVGEGAARERGQLLGSGGSNASRLRAGASTPGVSEADSDTDGAGVAVLSSHGRCVRDTEADAAGGGGHGAAETARDRCALPGGAEEASFEFFGLARILG